MSSTRGRRVVRLPAWLLYPLTQITWSLRLQSDSPAMGLDMVRYPWLASTEKIEREMGFRPRYSSWDAWETYVKRDETRRGGLAPEGTESTRWDEEEGRNAE